MFTSTMITRKHRFMIVIHILVIFINFDYSNGFEQDDHDRLCTIEEFQSCLKLLNTVSNGESDSALPVTESELEETCSDLKSGVICLDSHIQQCFSPEMQQVYILVATDAKTFVKHLCDNLIVQKEYLRHAKCYRNVSLDEHKCGQKYRKAVAISSDLEGKDLQSLDKESIMKKSCCALQDFVQCKHTHVLLDCGERASQFMEKHLPKITNVMLDQHCSAYTYGPACSELSIHDSQTSNTITKHINDIRLIISLILLKLIIN